jgi:hypothetical protein
MPNNRTDVENPEQRWHLWEPLPRNAHVKQRPTDGHSEMERKGFAQQMGSQNLF